MLECFTGTHIYIFFFTFKYMYACSVSHNTLFLGFSIKSNGKLFLKNLKSEAKKEKKISENLKIM